MYYIASGNTSTTVCRATGVFLTYLKLVCKAEAAELLLKATRAPDLCRLVRCDTSCCR
jgi:hypothetical protein